MTLGKVVPVWQYEEIRASFPYNMNKTKKKKLKITISGFGQLTKANNKVSIFILER